MLSFGWNSPYVFFIFCSLPQKYTLVPEAFLEFFLFMKERANSEAETTSCKAVRREEKPEGPEGRGMPSIFIIIVQVMTL